MESDDCFYIGMSDKGYLIKFNLMDKTLNLSLFRLLFYNIYSYHDHSFTMLQNKECVLCAAKVIAIGNGIDNQNSNQIISHIFMQSLNIERWRFQTVIIIIIMSCRQHGYPWPSLATSPYHSSPPAGLQGYILCPHIAAVCKFELVVLLLLGHMWGSIGVHHLRARPCFSSSVLRVWFI